MQEIERKFLVKNDSYKNLATAQKKIAQGYLNSAPEQTVRIRIKDDKEYLQNMYYNLLWYFERFKVQNKRSKKIKFYKWEIKQLKTKYQYGAKI